MQYEVLRLEHIGRLSDQEIISDISFSLYRREALCVITEDLDTQNFLFDFLQGNAVSASGSLYIEDIPRKLCNLEQAHQNGIYVIQESQLVSSMSVSDNLCSTQDSFYNRLKFLQPKKALTFTSSLLEKFSLTDINPSTKISTLSHSQQYMLAILQAYTRGARILIFDMLSHTPYLPDEIRRFLRMIQILKEEGLSLLWFSNKWSPVFQNFDRFAVMKEGVITQLEKLQTIPPVLSDTDFMRTRFNPRSVNLNLQKELLTFQDIEAPNCRPPHISFTLHEGELLGICDYSRILEPLIDNLLSGKLPPVGHITLEGQPYVPNLHARGQLAFICPNANHQRIFPQMELYDNVSLLLGNPMYNALGWMNKRIRNHMARTALESIGGEELILKYGALPALKKINVRDQLIIEISKWLCLKPKAFIFSNPYSTYDNLSGDFFQRILNNLLDQGISVILISQSEEHLSKFCTRMISIEENP